MPEGRTARQLTSRSLKKSRILRAAIEVFASKGYFAARMTDVAKTANVADGTLYLYFDGKEHLLLSIFDDVLTRFIDQLREEISIIDDPVDKLRVMLRLHLETLGRDRALAHVLQVETRHSRRFMSLFTRGRLGEYLSILRGIIEEGQELGSFRSDIKPSLATTLVFGAADEVVTSWLLAEDPGDLTRYIEPLANLLCEGLVPYHYHKGAGE
jgi:TetR/AcrR family fatty acid metabolism transcriptional regulator